MDAALPRLADEQEIYDVLMRYTRGVDRLDPELIAPVYHDDCYDHHGASNLLGKTYAYRVVERLRRNVDGHQHRISQLSLEFDGDVCWSEACLHSHHYHFDWRDRIDEFVGRYVDRFERRDGVWKIAERWVVNDFSRSSTVLANYEHEDSFLRGTRDRTDRSYHGGQRMLAGLLEAAGPRKTGIDMDDKRLKDALDKAEIRAVLARYARGVDRLDPALIASVYYDDAYDHHGRFDLLGKQFAVEVVELLRETRLSHQHRLANITIELDGDTAWSEAVLHSLHNHQDRVDEFFGRYVDRFERRQGEWKIAERWVVCDFSRSSPVSARFALQDTFLKGTRDRNDQSYQRKLPAEALASASR
jgi:ketosteroid isomerase-like protein